MADKIFPLVDRRAPVLERIRSRNGEQDKTELAKFGETLGKEMVALSKLEPEEKEEVLEEMVDGVVQGIVNATGVDADEVNRESIKQTLSVTSDFNNILNPPDNVEWDELVGEENEAIEE